MAEKQDKQGNSQSQVAGNLFDRFKLTLSEDEKKGKKSPNRFPEKGFWSIYDKPTQTAKGLALSPDNFDRDYRGLRWTVMTLSEKRGTEPYTLFELLEAEIVERNFSKIVSQGEVDDETVKAVWEDLRHRDLVKLEISGYRLASDFHVGDTITLPDSCVIGIGSEQRTVKDIADRDVMVWVPGSFKFMAKETPHRVD